MEKGNHAPLWSGRFGEGPNAEAVQFETSIDDDERMALDDIDGSIAHAAMLSRTGIIEANDAKTIIEGLSSIRKDIACGTLAIDKGAEDIHSFIEATLTDRVGDAGRRVHTGRSRNDQVALDERLYLRRTLQTLQCKIAEAVMTLADIAAAHLNTLMPGYTHMQHAQPVTLAHHLCAWAQPLVRDSGRLHDAAKRMDECPIGACALAGSGLALDREWEASQLGFEKITANSLDTVGDRDYCLEVSSALAILQMHLSRAAEEIVLWSTAEFDFVELSEAWSTGSSIMPQKKNPDFAELIRGRTGRVYGDMIALFTMMKGLPLAYDRDLQEDKHSLFDAIDTVSQCLQVFTQMTKTASWHTERMASECEGGYLNATDLADYLVQKGMPFREAHGTAAKAVRMAIDKSKTACGTNAAIRLQDLSMEDFKSISPLIKEDVFSALDTARCVAARRTTGGPARTAEQIAALKEWAKGNAAP